VNHERGLGFAVVRFVLRRCWRRGILGKISGGGLLVLLAI
jgi:hypothetical protein